MCTSCKTGSKNWIKIQYRVTCVFTVNAGRNYQNYVKNIYPTAYQNVLATGRQSFEVGLNAKLVTLDQNFQCEFFSFLNKIS